GDSAMPHARGCVVSASFAGRWPGSSPRDAEFFRALKGRPLGRARAAAFGPTCRAGARPRDDVNLRALIEAETEVVTIFGKAWELHARTALGVSAPENADLIESSVRFLKARV